MARGTRVTASILADALAACLLLVGSVPASPQEAPSSAPVLSAAAEQEKAGSTRDTLFGNETEAEESVSPWRGFVQGEVARAYQSPAHWSKARLRVELMRQGQLNEQVKWKIGGRFDYDAAYDLSSFYPPAVRDDQRREFALRENYLDVSAGDWDFRLGRQHVVWGEMVGIFVADVVSAKDMREFVLPEFDQLRIPQWAARAEYFKHDFHAELLWIPVPSFDKIGKPGADFYPQPLPLPSSFLGEQIPDRKLANTNYGLRLSQLKNGWDVSAFYYHSLDASPTFYRVSAAPAAPLVFQPRHDRIDQAGGTVTKDLGFAVLKGELVYTQGRRFNVTRLAPADGLVPQNTLDYALGLDFPLAGDVRLNVQFLQRIFFSHDPDIIPARYENAATVFVSGNLAPRLEAQALLIHSLNRSDWLFRPRLSWMFERNWRLSFGADIFGGPPTGLFGRFDNNDRIYTEMRYSF